MEAVGRRPRKAGPILLALITIQKAASVHQDSRVMECTLVKIWTKAKKGQPANARSANVRIPGVVMSAAAAAIYYTCENMTRA
ncbi:unnamed protein product [Camellia sinensis]